MTKILNKYLNLVFDDLVQEIHNSISKDSHDFMLSIELIMENFEKVDKDDRNKSTKIIDQLKKKLSKYVSQKEKCPDYMKKLINSTFDIPDLTTETLDPALKNIFTEYQKDMKENMKKCISLKMYELIHYSK
jgi:hypothetical protein